jgi:hypothetical protein
MAITTTVHTDYRKALANRLNGGSKMAQARWLIYEDSAGTPLRWLISDTAIETTEATYLITASGNLLTTASMTSPMVRLYLLGDLGSNSVPTATDMQAVLDAQADAAILTTYVIQYTDFTAGDVIAFTAGDYISGTQVVTH